MKRIEEAKVIAESYMREHGGALPLIVIAHGKKETFNLIGVFRPKHEVVDLKTFCSVMRHAFILHKVESYEFVVKPRVQIKYAPTDLLAIMVVNYKNKIGKFFEIEDTKLIEYANVSDADLPIIGFLAQLLPTVQTEKISTKEADGINSYLSAIKYKPLILEEEPINGLEFLLAMD